MEANLRTFFPNMPTVFVDYLKDRVHIWLEKKDAEGDLQMIDQWVGNDKVKKAFLDYHIKMTSPVFGEWNYTKRKSTKA